MELRNSVSAAFGLELPATATFDHPTIAALAAFISSRVAPSPEEEWAAPGDAAGHEVVLHTAAPSAAAILAQLQARVILGKEFAGQICMTPKLPVSGAETAKRYFSP